MEQNPNGTKAQWNKSTKAITNAHKQTKAQRTDTKLQTNKGTNKLKHKQTKTKKNTNKGAFHPFRRSSPNRLRQCHLRRQGRPRPLFRGIPASSPSLSSAGGLLRNDKLLLSDRHVVPRMHPG